MPLLKRTAVHSPLYLRIASCPCCGRPSNFFLFIRIARGTMPRRVKKWWLVTRAMPKSKSGDGCEVVPSMVPRLIASGTSVTGMPIGTAPKAFTVSPSIAPEERIFLPLMSAIELSGVRACRLQGTAAKRAVGKELDLDRTGRFLVDRLGPRLHHREEGLLLVGREDGELELGLGSGMSRRDDAEHAERETQGFHEASSGCKIIIF